VVALRQSVFRFSERRSASVLATYFERIFFQHPWPDDDLPSWVHEDASGRVVGFLGVMPRRMVWRGQVIRMAVATQLMVEPQSRGLIGRSLVRAFLAGPQDCSLSDTANDAARRLWESLGAGTSTIHSLVWLRPLRPCRDITARIARGLAARGALYAARPLVAAGDAVAARLSGGAARKPAGTIQPLTPTLMLAHLDVLGCRALRPVYEQGALDWLLDQVAEKRQFGTLERALVREPAGRVAGWFLYFLNSGGASQIVQFAARPAAHTLVLQHLFHHAWSRGAAALVGRLEPALVPDLAALGCGFGRDGPWVMIHSHRPEIMPAVERGDAFLSRLDGEWWLSF
jgi:hypothetical protein